MRGRKKLGKILCEMGLITEKQLEKALHRQGEKQQHQTIGSILMEMDLINEEQLAQALACQFNLPFIDLQGELPAPETAKRIPETKARHCRALAFGEEHGGSTLLIAVADPTDISILDNLRETLNEKVEFFVGVPSEISRMIETVYSEKEEINVVEIAHRVIDDALERGASDIHIEPGGEKLSVRYRVDGVLENGFSIPKQVHPFLISRLKILAGMDIGEKRRPQDGRLKLDKPKEWDLRLSTLPAYHGEKMAIRVLDRFSVPEVKDLGFRKDQVATIRKILSFQEGIFLVVGPTGSGKTTTLFSMLRELQKGNLNITTVEDPIEYILPSINQIQVNSKIGLTFASLLRAILRQDPDVIMVGEIRDEETAKIAVNAALTGHLVLSTLHTYDAPSALIRLLEMGIEPYLVASTVIGIMGQRLVRKFCPQCENKKRELDWKRAVSSIYDLETDKVSEDMGCSSCYGTGYRGRTGIAEILIPDDGLREKVVQKKTGGELRKNAAKIMDKNIKEEGLEKVELGETSLQEVLRVVRT